ncbi:MAG: hypothetical protein WCG47_25120 [Dermatophilaceae bacterium]
MTPVWAVAPHPDATAEEAPGSFRRHDIRAFRRRYDAADLAAGDADVRSYAGQRPQLVEDYGGTRPRQSRRTPRRRPALARRALSKGRR